MNLIKSSIFVNYVLAVANQKYLIWRHFIQYVYIYTQYRFENSYLCIGFINITTLYHHNIGYILF